MNIDQRIWKRIEELFAKALELPDHERNEFLDRECDADPRVKTEVLSLLESHDRSGDFSLMVDSDEQLRGELRKIAQEIHRDSESGRGSIHSMQAEAEIDSEAEFIELAQTLEGNYPDFTDLKLISRGGAGAVFRGHQISLGRDVAIKILLNHRFDQAARKRFLAESQATAKVRHDNVVEIYSVHADEQLSFLVMEYLEGVTLKEILETGQYVSPQQVARIVRQVAAGLHAAHQQGLVHRDVKPANVILMGDRAEIAADSRVKLIDFGIARDLNSATLTEDQLLIGTLAYMSPEQLTAPQTIDHRSDVFGLGATMYELMTGQPPFVGAPHMVLAQIKEDSPAPPRKYDDRIPKDLQSICLKALRSAPDRRYDSAKAMADDLERFEQGRPTIARPVSQWERGVQWCRRNTRLAIAIGASLSLLVSLAIGSLTFAIVVAEKNREINRQRLMTRQTRLERLLDAEAGALALAIESLGAINLETRQRLKLVVQEPGTGINRKFNAAITLALNGEAPTSWLIDSMDELFESPAICQNLIAAFKRDPDAVAQLRAALDATGQGETAINRKAKLVILLAFLGDLTPWRDAASDLQDPTLRTAIIHQFPTWRGQASELAQLAEQHQDQPWCWTLCQSLMELEPRSLSSSDSSRVVQLMRQLTQSQYYSTSLFARLVIQKFTAETVELREPPAGSQWFADGLEPHGITMVQIDPGETMLGQFDPAIADSDHPPRRVKLTRAYSVADAEVSVDQFAKFANDGHALESFDQWKVFSGFTGAISPSGDHPIQSVSWFEAVRYCNWLSQLNGLPAAYRKLDRKQTVELDDGSTKAIEVWELIPDSVGFRLPTDAEWEYAARSDSRTRFFFGQDERWFDQYGFATVGRVVETLPVRALRPNPRGLYGTLGNVWEWTHNRYEAELAGDDSQVLVDPLGPRAYSAIQFGRVNQGGGVNTASGDVSSESRGYTGPWLQYSNLGFRVARTLPAKQIAAATQ